jgi:hypothetical protein
VAGAQPCDVVRDSPFNVVLRLITRVLANPRDTPQRSKKTLANHEDGDSGGIVLLATHSDRGKNHFLVRRGFRDRNRQARSPKAVSAFSEWPTIRSEQPLADARVFWRY